METIGMVLVQEDEELQEHVIYYISQNIIDAEIRYSYVEKLALATVHAVQWLRHYILLRQTLVVAHVNPFQFVLTRRMIGVKYNKWIVLAKSKNSLIFAELILDFLSEAKDLVCEDTFVDEHIFLISTLEPWYGISLYIYKH